MSLKNIHKITESKGDNRSAPILGFNLLPATLLLPKWHWNGRMAETAARLTDEILPAVPVRQWVPSTPFEIRYRPAWDGNW